MRIRPTWAAALGGTDGTGRTSGRKAVPGASRRPGSADIFRRTVHNRSRWRVKFRPADCFRAARQPARRHALARPPVMRRGGGRLPRRGWPRRRCRCVAPSRKRDESCRALPVAARAGWPGSGLPDYRTVGTPRCQESPRQWRSSAGSRACWHTRTTPKPAVRPRHAQPHPSARRLPCCRGWRCHYSLITP